MTLQDLLKDHYKDGMTLEEVERALSGLSLNDGAELDRLKNALSKSNAEAAEYKKQLREKQTEQERLEAERVEKDKQRDELLAQLQREKSLSDLKARFLANGFDEALASESAAAFVDNDVEKLFLNQKKHLDAVEQRVKAEVLRNTPEPYPGGNPGGEDWDKKIEAARSAGDMSATAYYTRMKAMSEANNT